MRALTAVALAFATSARADWMSSNLTPAGAWDAEIYAVTPSSQFGSARLGVAPDAPQALIWHGSSAAWTSLGVSPSIGTRIYSANETLQAGAMNTRACLWYGTPQSRVDLHPSGSLDSEVRALSGSNQYGFVELSAGGNPQAAKWSGTAASYVSMAPPGASASNIVAAVGGLQGGGGTFAGFDRAGIWSGTASSFVNLHPGPAYTNSFIYGMAPGEQVGGAGIINSTVAGLWHGTAQSFVSLDPGWNRSTALATLGGVEVGWTNLDLGDDTHAALWFGTAASFVDLSQFLPAGHNYSVATSIASDGSFYYIGGYANNMATGYRDAIFWVGTVPSPPVLPLMVAPMLLAFRRRRLGAPEH